MSFFKSKWEKTAEVLTKEADIEAKMERKVMSYVANVFGSVPDYINDRHAQAKRNSNWIFVAADRIGKAAMANCTRFQLYRERAGEDEPLPYTHYLYKMLYNPNHRMSWSRLVYLTMYCQHALPGQSYWYSPTNAIGRPSQFYFMFPTYGYLEVKKDDFDDVVGYRLIKRDGQEELFRPEEILHFKYPTIESESYGKSPGMAFAETHELDVAMKRFYVGVMQNSGFHSFMFSPKDGSARWTPDQAKEFLMAYNDKFTAGSMGGYVKAGQAIAPAIPLEATRLAYAPKDMESNEFLRNSRDQIKDAYGLPKIDEATNRSVAETALLVFYMNAVQPALDLFADDLTMMFVKKYEPDVYMKYDSILPEDRQADAEYWKTLIESGQKTINEARASRGDLAVDGGDDPLIGGTPLPLLIQKLMVELNTKGKIGDGNGN